MSIKLLPRSGSKWVDERGVVWTCDGCYEPFESQYFVSMKRNGVLEGHPEVMTYESMPLPLDMFRQLFKPHLERKP